MESMMVNANSKEWIKDVAYQETYEATASAGQTLLGVTASAAVVSAEASDDEFRVTVRTTFTAVKYDEEGNYYREEESTESVRTAPCRGLTPASVMKLRATVTDCETLPAQKKAKATIAVGGWYIKENEIALLDPSESGLICKTESAVFESATPLADRSVPVSFTEEARMPIVSVLDSYATVTVDGVYASEGSYRTEGEVVVRILAVADNGQFVTQSFSHPFNTESAEEFVKEGTKLDVEASVSDLRLSVTENDKRLVVADVTVTTTGTALTETEADKVVDAYSLTNELEREEKSYLVNSHFCVRCGREKASEVVKAGAVGEILGVLHPCVNASVRRTDGNVEVFGSVGVTCLYLGENGDRRALKAGIPFATELGEFDCDTVFAPEVVVGALGARPRGGDEIELSAELSVTLRGARERETQVVCGVTIGEEKEEDDCAVCLYIVRNGESLWDVAKALNTEEKTLCELNPDVQLPLTGGEKILLYRALA